MSVITLVEQQNTQQKQNILYNICTMLDRRRRRWADVVQMLYKCLVFAGYTYQIRKRITDILHFLNIGISVYQSQILYGMLFISKILYNVATGRIYSAVPPMLK